MKNKSDITTLTFQLTQKLKRKIKSTASNKNESIKDFLTKIIEKYFKLNEVK